MPTKFTLRGCSAPATKLIDRDRKTNMSLETYWQEELAILENRVAYCDKRISMLRQFDSMWDYNSSWVKTMQNSIKIQKTDERSIHSAPCRAKLKVRASEKREMNGVLVRNVSNVLILMNHQLCYYLRKTTFPELASIIER